LKRQAALFGLKMVLQLAFYRFGFCIIGCNYYNSNYSNFINNPFQIYKLADQYGYGLPPEAEKMLQRISDEYSEHGFSITVTLFTLIIDIVTYPLFGFLGGIIAASLYSKRRQSTPNA
jgi:hypothetical protein